MCRTHNVCTFAVVDYISLMFAVTRLLQISHCGIIKLIILIIFIIFLNNKKYNTILRGPGWFVEKNYV